MALSQVEIEARITALRAARDSGVLTVRHGDTFTTYRSLSEISRILASLESDLATITGKTRQRVGYVSQPGKGF